MSLHRFFLNDQTLSDSPCGIVRLRLDDGDLRHAEVLRLKPKEHIAVVDAASDYFECEVVSFEDDLIVKISSHRDVPKASFEVALFLALAKGSKTDEVVCHATELGVGEYYPFASSRCVVKLDGDRACRRQARLGSVAKSAAIQSGAAKMPKVHVPSTFEEALSHLASFDCALVFWEEAQRTCTLAEALSGITPSDGQSVKVAIAIGPEGGFEEAEVHALQAANDNSYLLSLGEHILRCETAAIVASALAIYELGGLGA